MNLYKIKEEYREWQQKIISQDGELFDEDIEALNNLEAIAEDKIEAYAVIIKESLSEAEMYKAEADRLTSIAKKKINLADKLKTNLDNFMKEQGREKFESVKTKISYRKSTALEIDCTAEVPEKFQKIKTEIDKTAITNFLKEGNVLEGFQLVERRNIQIK